MLHLDMLLAILRAPLMLKCCFCPAAPVCSLIAAAASFGYGPCHGVKDPELPAGAVGTVLAAAVTAAHLAVQLMYCCCGAAVHQTAVLPAAAFADYVNAFQWDATSGWVAAALFVPQPCHCNH